MDTQQETKKQDAESTTAEQTTPPTEETTVESRETGEDEILGTGQEEGEDTPGVEPVSEEAAEHSEAAEEESEDFEKVFEAWEAKLKTLKEGEVVKGKVLKILDQEVIIDIGYKSEGVIDLSEFRARGTDPKVEIGDEIDVLLEKTEDADGYVVLSKEKAEKLKVWDVVEKAYETGEPIEGRVVDRIKGGLKIDIGLPAFLPGSLVDIRPVRNLESLRGGTFRMRVIKVNKRRGNIVLSRKAILEEENAEKKSKTLSDLEEGKIFRGVVKNLTEYGAFIDLGGIDGLLHITDMSWGRINHPSEKFQISDEVDVIVLKFDRERERVSLGFKQLQEDPWEFTAQKFPINSRIRGKVVSLTDYGAFVEVEEGIEGLVHVSEMSWTKRVKHPSKLLSVGDWVECVVLDIDQEARRLSLGLKQTEPNPWEVIGSKYRIGDEIVGNVRNITDFGAFIEVEEGIDGLVHISDLSWTKRVKHPSEILQKGEEVKAVILKIDSESQRLSLGIKQLQPNALEDFFQSHGVGNVLTGKIVRLTEFGAFVELQKGVEGLVHVSEMSQDRIEKPEDAFNVDQEVKVKIIKIDPVERKIGLSIKAAEDEAETATFQSYVDSKSAGGGATLGDLLSAKVLRDSSAPQQEEDVAAATEEPPEAEAKPDEPAEAGQTDADDEEDTVTVGADAVEDKIEDPDQVTPETGETAEEPEPETPVKAEAEEEPSDEDDRKKEGSEESD